MTAGKGVVHGEMFPLVNSDAPNTLRLFQIWLNLPAKSKMVDPCYVMHWHEKIPVVEGRDGSRVTVWAGSFGGESGLPPPPNSYGASKDADLAVLFIQLPPGASVTIPPAASGSRVNRSLYFTEGKQASVGQQSVAGKTTMTLDASMAAEVTNTDTTEPAELLLLQGRPIGEPVAQQGPFVMNTNAEIQQAYADYRRTQFGGWPWPDDAMVFPRGKGRFSKQAGVEETP
jgi:redox-sensitive bicupin YhaK (pirin superfamily)